MFAMVENDHPPLPPDISVECEDFLMLCFQKDPQKRPSAAELKQHWFLKKLDNKEIDFSSIPNNLIKYNTQRCK
jgi:serine/threonine protein kinase